jgi:hypothetical protein
MMHVAYRPILTTAIPASQGAHIRVTYSVFDSSVGHLERHRFVVAFKYDYDKLAWVSL